MASEAWVKRATMAWAVDRGLTIEWVSWYDARARRSHDLAGYWDALAGEDGDAVLIQATSKTNHAARVKKCSQPAARAFAEAIGARNLVLSFEHEWDKGPREEVIR